MRASMAIPFFFEPVRFRAPAGTIGGQQFPSDDVVWVDGGMLDNYPLDVFDRTDGVPARWPTLGIKLSAKQAIVNTASGVHHLPTETMACLHTLLDNGDRYYIDTDQQRPPWTIFVDSTGMAATDFGLTAQTTANAVQQWAIGRPNVVGDAGKGPAVERGTPGPQWPRPVPSGPTRPPACVGPSLCHEVRPRRRPFWVQQLLLIVITCRFWA